VKKQKSGRAVSYPHNMPIGSGSDNADERIRLLFVALTRAKNKLHLSHHTLTPSGKEVLPAAYLSTETITHDSHVADDIETAETLWHDTLLRPTSITMKELLADTLEHYKISPTHIGTYLDVSRGGPSQFLFQHLLHFPQAMSPSAAYGSAVHETMRSAHAALKAKGKKRPIEDLLGDFEKALQKHQLSNEQYEKFSKRGSDVLSAYFGARYDSFMPSQVPERSFTSDNIVLGSARITGVIDMLDIDETNKTITVTDYKTGKAVPSWKGRTEYEKVKLHHYRQQLMFYKLLVEHSRQLAGYTVTGGYIDFVEPDDRGNFHRLELIYDEKELNEFRSLIHKVWVRIQDLDFHCQTSTRQH
jgi:DNA helicase-2/ATP-dependent DNA helicase PcrA